MHRPRHRGALAAGAGEPAPPIWRRRDHDRAVEKLRDEPLSDGCSAKEYTGKLETLMKHQPHLERKLEGEELNKFIIRLM